MRMLLFRLYWKLEKLLFPSLKSSQYHYLDLLKSLLPTGCLWLDTGCGHQLFGSWMIKEERELAARAKRLIGIDLDLEGLRKHLTINDRVFGSLEKLPFASESFDVVTANMVVEHLSSPHAVLSEIRRVLRPGGLFIFHTPNLYCVVITISSRLPQRLKNFLALVLENRSADDVFPTFYRMNSRRTIEKEAARADFDLQEYRAVSTSAATIMLGPLVIFELLYLRILEASRFRDLRSNIIATLRKPNHL